MPTPRATHGRRSVAGEGDPGPRSAAERRGRGHRTIARSIVVALVVPALLAGASLALLVGGHDQPTRSSLHAPVASRRAAAVMRPLRRSPRRRHHSTMSLPTSRFSVASPKQVATRFAVGWLSCSYHQATCSRLPDALPAYATAFEHQRGTALPTPAEVDAHLEVLSTTLTPTCPVATVALVIYTDGAGGRFVLHVNLLRTRVGWRVFDVAEAPPHIPLPIELGHGPTGC
jgi:hypothetical protein